MVSHQEPSSYNGRMSRALLIIDMINSLDFPEGKALLKQALPVAHTISKIKEQMRKKNLPVIYVNDNFGHWKADWMEVYNWCSDKKHIGSRLSPLIKPDAKDYFVLKPKHSGFYGTNLDILLQELKVKELIVTGIAGNICVLFTVNDAYMRGYKIHVPSDAIASNTKKENDYVLKLLKETFKVRTSKYS